MAFKWQTVVMPYLFDGAKAFKQHWHPQNNTFAADSFHQALRTGLIAQLLFEKIWDYSLSTFLQASCYGEKSCHVHCTEENHSTLENLSAFFFDGAARFLDVSHRRIDCGKLMHLVSALKDPEEAGCRPRF